MPLLSAVVEERISMIFDRTALFMLWVSFVYISQGCSRHGGLTTGNNYKDIQMIDLANVGALDVLARCSIWTTHSTQ